MSSTTIKYFKYEHLKPKLQDVCKPIAVLANLMENELFDGPEKSAGMRKLLEAKDCFVRSALDGGVRNDLPKVFYTSQDANAERFERALSRIFHFFDIEWTDGEPPVEDLIKKFV